VLQTGLRHEDKHVVEEDGLKKHLRGYGPRTAELLIET
jgi:hypothetical protein